MSRPEYPFPLDVTFLTELAEDFSESLDEMFTKERAPGRLRIDIAREHRNDDFFAGIFRKVINLVPMLWALGELAAARDRLALAPAALREAYDYDWNPHAGKSQDACAVAIILGDAALAATAAAADGGFAVLGPDGAFANTTDLSECHQTKCLAHLAGGDDEGARAELEAMGSLIEDSLAASDRRLLSAHARMLGAVLDGDEDALAEAARAHTERLLDHIAAQADPEGSGDLIDWVTTAVLALASRRQMAVPCDLPTCPVELIRPEWER